MLVESQGYYSRSFTSLYSRVSCDVLRAAGVLLTHGAIHLVKELIACITPLQLETTPGLCNCLPAGEDIAEYSLLCYCSACSCEKNVCPRCQVLHLAAVLRGLLVASSFTTTLLDAGSKKVNAKWLTG